MTFDRPGGPIDRAALAVAVQEIVDQVVVAALGREEPDDERLLVTVAVASVTADAARRCLDDAVQQARLQGVSWGAIGDTLGISRQAAFQRFRT